MRNIIYGCDACPNTVHDVYTKNWIHLNGHIAVANGRDLKTQEGFSYCLDGDFYFCSWDCFFNYLVAHLAIRQERD